MNNFRWRDCYAGFLNLDHRQDRRDHMNSEFTRVGLSAIRHRGKLPNEYDLNDPSLSVMKNRTPGAIPCHFGQIEIMREALRLGKSAIVFEDDLVFCSDIHDRLDHIEQFINSKEPDFSVVWLGGTFHSPAFWHPKGRSKMNPDCSANIGRDCEPTDDPRMMRTYGAFSTFAYIVNVNSITKILDLLNKHVHESIGIDWLFIKLQPQLKCFAYVPGCVKQIDNESDIGTGITRFSGFEKLNGTVENSRYWFQDRKEDFDPTTFVWK